MRFLPYNTGKVKIGLRYDPRPVYYITADDERLQRALLGAGRSPVSVDHWIKVLAWVAFLVLGLMVVAR